MLQWDTIFKEKGRFFLKPQEDMAKIVRLFKKNKVKRVLGLGCGSGRHTVFLAKRGFKVYGVDVSKSGINLTRQWLRKEKLEANLKTGNVFQRLPYPDNLFDAVISIQVINHGKIDNIRSAIKEIQRVLKPQGFLFITVQKSFNKYKRNRKLVASRTYIPLKCWEKGLPHYIFNRQLLEKEFKNFRPEVWVEKSNIVNRKIHYRPHYALFGRLEK
ncbi:class I SAM-dependent methyltransferase [Candidatus Parcubacteria bacterium]|nr:MAG: class I SAM-dependent methyltransferase [Candidatus Parcubacteria bacterium]